MMKGITMDHASRMALLREVQTYAHAQQHQLPLPMHQSLPPPVMARLAQQYLQKQQQAMLRKCFRQAQQQQQQQMLAEETPAGACIAGSAATATATATAASPPPASTVAKRPLHAMTSNLVVATAEAAPTSFRQSTEPCTSVNAIATSVATASGTAPTATAAATPLPPKKRIKLDASTGVVPDSPAKFVLRTFYEHCPDVKAHLDRTERLRVKPTQDMITGYTQDKLMAVRRNNLDELRRLWTAGASLECCNKFGESIVHLACRRGLTDIVRFLVAQAGVSLNLADDYKRTPLHDACWTPEPNFELVELLLRRAPEQVVMKDVRGFTPFDYVRRGDWPQWMTFLRENWHLLRPRPSGVDCAVVEQDSVGDRARTSAALDGSAKTSPQTFAAVQSAADESLVVGQ